MNPQSLLTLFDATAMTALAPMIALALGTLAVLACGIVPGGSAVRPIAFLASLAASAAFCVKTLVDGTPAVLVLEGTFRWGPTTAVWGLVFLASTLFAWLFSAHYYEEDAPFKGEHDVLMLATPIGMLLMAGAHDLLVFFIGLELLSIPLYSLAAFRRDRIRSVEAGLKYFLLGAFAAAFFLYGAALVYATTGSLSLDAFADPTRRAVILDQPLALVGVALIASSVFFKVSVFPFHLWVPDVYEGSPTPVTALMATGTKAAAFAFLLNALALLPNSTAGTIALIAVITMAAGNFGALAQTDVKRMLAYSGIAHAGTLLLGLAGSLHGDPARGGAIEAALFYMAAYVATAGGAFGLLALLEREHKGSTTLESLKGLAQRRPVVAAALTLFMLSLGGIPATGGFLGKYLVFSVAVRGELVPYAILGVLLSVVALGYYLRVVIAMYMQSPAEGSPVPESRPTPFATTLAGLVCAALVLGLGILPRWFLEAM